MIPGVRSAGSDRPAVTAVNFGPAGEVTGFRSRVYQVDSGCKGNTGRDQ